MKRLAAAVVLSVMTTARWANAQCAVYPDPDTPDQTLEACLPVGLPPDIFGARTQADQQAQALKLLQSIQLRAGQSTTIGGKKILQPDGTSLFLGGVVVTAFVAETPCQHKAALVSQQICSLPADQRDQAQASIDDLHSQCPAASIPPCPQTNLPAAGSLFGATPSFGNQGIGGRQGLPAAGAPQLGGIPQANNPSGSAPGLFGSNVTSPGIPVGAPPGFTGAPTLFGANVAGGAPRGFAGAPGVGGGVVVPGFGLAVPGAVPQAGGGIPVGGAPVAVPAGLPAALFGGGIPGQRQGPGAPPAAATSLFGPAGPAPQSGGSGGNNP